MSPIKTLLVLQEDRSRQMLCVKNRATISQCSSKLPKSTLFSFHTSSVGAFIPPEPFESEPRRK